MKGIQNESPTATKPIAKRKICLYWDYFDSLVDGYDSFSEEKTCPISRIIIVRLRKDYEEADLITK